MHVATTPKAPIVQTPRRRLYEENEVNYSSRNNNILISIANSIIYVAKILRDYQLR